MSTRTSGKFFSGAREGKPADPGAAGNGSRYRGAVAPAGHVPAGEGRLFCVMEGDE